MQADEIDHRFKAHSSPNEGRKQEHEAVRQECRALAHWLNTHIPEGREKSLAVTHLEEVMFWSNVALARQ